MTAYREGVSEPAGVLVVGAGPPGLAMAAFLAAQESAPADRPRPRARPRVARLGRG
jgi:flavin-dependent dehydrogenase